MPTGEISAAFVAAKPSSQQRPHRPTRKHKRTWRAQNGKARSDDHDNPPRLHSSRRAQQLLAPRQVRRQSVHHSQRIEAPVRPHHDRRARSLRARTAPLARGPLRVDGRIQAHTAFLAGRTRRAAPSEVSPKGDVTTTTRGDSKQCRAGQDYQRSTTTSPMLAAAVLGPSHTQHDSGADCAMSLRRGGANPHLRYEVRNHANLTSHGSSAGPVQPGEARRRLDGPIRRAAQQTRARVRATPAGAFSQSAKVARHHSTHDTARSTPHHGSQDARPHQGHPRGAGATRTP